MHRRIAMCLVAVLPPCLRPGRRRTGGAWAAAGDGVEADGGLLIDRIDPERLRQIRTERNRQYILGLGLLAASGAVGFSKQNWVVDEGAIGYAIVPLGVAAFRGGAVRGAVEGAGKPVRHAGAAHG